MKQLFKLGWRNIFRNTRRTLLTSLVIGIGLAALIFVDALLIGMTDNIIKRATGTFLGEGQIHAPGFRQTFQVENTINNLGEVLTLIKNTKAIAAHAQRIATPCMVSSPRNISSVTLYGIDPSQERNLSKIHRAMTSGSFLHHEDGRLILLGSDLADLLEVNIGDRVVATAAQAHTGDLAQELFRVGGIFRFGEPVFDRGTAFISLPKAQAMLGIGEQVHEITLKFHDQQTATSPRFTFWKEATTMGNEALYWKDLSPGLRALLELTHYSTLFTGIILFLLVMFIIMNTLFMALFERMVEFGILRAIGTRPKRLAALIVIEAGSIAFVSSIIGIVIAVCFAIIIQITGIDYTGIDIGGVTIAEPMYPVLRWYQLTVFPLIVLLFTIVAALYPAISAARIIPVKALQHKGQ